MLFLRWHSTCHLVVVCWEPVVEKGAQSLFLSSVLPTEATLLTKRLVRQWVQFRRQFRRLLGELS